MKNFRKIGKFVLLFPLAWSSLAMADQCRAVWAFSTWQDMNYPITAGQYVCISAGGLWSHGAQGAQGIVPWYGPQGYGKTGPATVPEFSARAGALIGRIGTNSPFLVENQVCFTATKGGPLQLSMNDVSGGFTNNLGHLYVRIGTWPRAPSFPNIDLDPDMCAP
jgi:hypothetical protein